MSRSALLKQQGRVKEREELADELFRQAVEEGRSKSRSCIPLWGPDDGTFHWNPLLLQNTIRSPYFQKCCSDLKDWSAVIDEIYYEVKHLMPFQDGSMNKAPSTAFCLLLRLLTLRMNPHQMERTLQHPDSPYIRGIGFLYLRYVCPPEQIWQWIEPYALDNEELVVKTGRQGKATTIGDFVRRLFSNEREYYGTALPRLPIQIEREIMVKLLQAEKIAERAAQHFKNQQRMRYLQTLGSRIMALYGDDENPMEWYEAVVDRVITRDEKGNTLVHPKFVVTFTEYGNTETVTLGEVDVLDGKWKFDNKNEGQHGRGYDRRQRGSDLYDEVRRRERDGVTAEKGWARRPPTTKTSLSSVSRSGYVVQDDYRPPRRPQPAQSRERAYDNVEQASQSLHAPAPEPHNRKRTAEELAAIEDKKRRLLAKYG